MFQIQNQIANKIIQTFQISKDCKKNHGHHTPPLDFSSSPLLSLSLISSSSSLTISLSAIFFLVPFCLKESQFHDIQT